MSSPGYVRYLLVSIIVCCGFCIQRSQQQCTFNWTITEGVHAFGYAEFGTRGSVTEDQCKEACQSRPECRAMDYNTQDRSCFLGNVSNSQTVSQTGINHGELTRNCPSSGQTSASQASTAASGQTSSVTQMSGSASAVTGITTAGCTFNWTITEGVHALGYAEFGTRGSVTEDQCKEACQSRPECRAMDYNTQDRSCFIGNVSNSPTGSQTGINHGELTRNCLSSGQSTTTGPTLTASQGSDQSSSGSQMSTSANTGSTTTAQPTALESEGCRTTFTLTQNRVSLNGVYIPPFLIDTQFECLFGCINTPLCVGMEFKPDVNGTGDKGTCWYHFSSSDFDKFYFEENIVQYILHRCPEADLGLCIANFTMTGPGQFSPNGTLVPEATTLEDCERACQDSAPKCRGLDFYDDKRCMLHSVDSLGKNLQQQSGVSQYRLIDTCSSVCLPKWKKSMNSMGTGAKPVEVTLPKGNETACLEFCLRNRTCIGVVYMKEGSSPSTCSYFDSTQRSDMEQRKTTAWATQWELEDRCASSCATSYPIMKDTDIGILEVEDVPANNPAECEAYCHVHATCDVYQYTKVGPFICTIGQTPVPGSEVHNTSVDSALFKYDKCTNEKPTLPPTPVPTGTTMAPGSAGTGSSLSSGSAMSTITSNSTETCSSNWTKTEGKHMAGLSEHGKDGDYTEEECLKQCEAMAGCKAADYNKLDKGCYLSTAPASPENLLSNPNINHWDLKVTCTSNSQPSTTAAVTVTGTLTSAQSNSTGTSGGVSTGSSITGASSTTVGNSTSSCEVSWNKTEGRHVRGLSEHGRDGDYTEEECLKQCEAMAGCKAADYNTLDKGCYLSTAHTPVGDLSTNPNINHWELYQLCSSSGQNSSATTGGQSTTASSSNSSAASSSSSSESTAVPSSNATSAGSATAAQTSSSSNVTSMMSQVTSSPSNTSSGCKWELQDGMNSPGLPQVGATGQYDEETCKKLCELNAKCHAVDYNTQDKTCFHGEDPDYFTVTNAAVHHWILRERCTGQCTATVSASPGMLTPGLEQYGSTGQYTESGCKDACLLNDKCYSCDYNTVDKTCFLGFIRDPYKVAFNNVNHYDFNRTCPDATTTST